jgi:hypothetical protein
VLDTINRRRRKDAVIYRKRRDERKERNESI